MVSNLNRRQKALALLLALTLVRGVIYVSVIPPWQAPDEFRHFEYIKLLQQKRRFLRSQDTSLPLQREIIASMIEHNYWKFGRAVYPFDPWTPPQSFKEIIWPVDPYWLFQPPLYYIMGASLVALVDGSNDIDLQLYAVRLMSVTLGLLVVFVAVVTATVLFSDDDLLVIGIPAFITFLPMHTFITSAVNNDNLAELIVSVVVLILVLVFKEGPSLKRTALISVLIGLGLLTKRTTIVTVPLTLAAILICSWKARSRIFHLSRTEAGLMIAVLIMGIGSVVEFWSVWQRLWVRILPTLRPYFILIHGADFSGIFTSESLRLFTHYVTVLFESFWARFGWMNVRLDPIWYQLVALVSVAAILGVGILAIRTVRSPATMAPWQKQCLLLFFLCVAFAIAIAMGYGIRLWAHFRSFQSGIRAVPPQGRYIFVAIIPIASLFMLGLRELAPSGNRRLWLQAFVGGIVLFDSIALLHYVIPFFYG